MSIITSEISHKVLTDNTAQAVLNHLKEQESNRKSRLTRWIWELLQNARDTSANADVNLVASVEYKWRKEEDHGELIFQHNGTKFKVEDIAHLIYHGSTKVEDKETIGQYGSGFLTTHLLSPKIDISGQLEDDEYFQFCLKREIDSVEKLSNSMQQAENAFNESQSSEPPKSLLDDFATRFQYPIDNGSVDAVEEGLATLKKSAPFVVVFNKQFLCINIKSPDGNMNFEVKDRQRLPQSGLQKITVSISEDGNQQDKVYLLAESERTSVAVPLESTDNGHICLPVDDIPRLFLGFPLVGTENFSFPAVINSFEFGPTEGRNGVFLGKGDDEVNDKNKSIVQEACELHICLLSFAALSGWRNTFTLAKVPVVREPEWLDKAWLKATLKEQLIEQFRQTRSVVSEVGGAIPASKSILPMAEKDEDIEALWDLLNGWIKFRDMLPRRDEAAGWSCAIKSWSTIYGEDDPSLFDETMDGEKLASHIDDATHNDDRGDIDDLRALLHEDVSTVDWLDQFHQFLNENSLQETVRDYHIVLDQKHNLDQLSNLHRDQGISEKLKDIAELLGWKVRLELRYVGISSLASKEGAGDMKNEDIVKRLIGKLKERAEQNPEPDDDFAKASVGLFSWIVGKEDWDQLRRFPVFAEDAESDKRKVIYLECTEEKDDLPLSPILAWPKDLQPYSELFPWRFILAKRLSDVVPDKDVWKVLEKQGFLRRDVIITKNLEIDFAKFLSDESWDEEENKRHETDGSFAVTDIAFLNKNEVGIMERVRKSRPLAGKFWRFLTEYVVNRDACGLEMIEEDCSCGKRHRYFPAMWLVPLTKNKWVPLERSGQSKATAESLGSLLHSIGEGTSYENEKMSKLLKAIGVKHYDLMLETIAEDSDSRENLENTITDMLITTRGDLGPVQDFMQDMREDENLLKDLERRREMRRMGHKNQCLGQRVEDLVRRNLESKGFTVDRTGTGSDFEISAENGDVANLDISLGDRDWLIEVKSTRDQEVRMTHTQAKTSVKEGDRFLLCVVPVEDGNTELELDVVQDTMRFVQGIGSRVASLCKGIEVLENLRDGITTNGSSGIRLEVESGKARIRVANSVWENDGFRIEDLAERLARPGNSP